jgi:hypothetical protein
MRNGTRQAFFEKLSDSSGESSLLVDKMAVLDQSWYFLLSPLVGVENRLTEVKGSRRIRTL